MAATFTPAQVFKDYNNDSNNGNPEITRKEIQAAIAKAVELRALHAALRRGSSPANARFPSPSPATRPASQFSAQDYPVFTPSYEDDPLPGYNQNPMKSLTISESWEENGLEGGNSIDTIVPDYKEKSSSRKGLPYGFAHLESHICPADDSNTRASSSAPVTSALSSWSTSVATPTATQSAPITEPTLPIFPFPGSNGTYYICSFPSNSTGPVTSTASASSASIETASVTLTNDILTPSGVPTSSVSASVTKPVPTSFSGSVPTPTPTEFTVVGPSTTAVIECIAIPTGAHPHPPPPSNDSSVPPTALPTVTPNTLTSSIPTSSPLSSTLV